MRTTIVTLALLVLASSGASGQDFPRATRLADGVYAYEQVDPSKAGVTACNLIVISDDGVLVADGQGTVENTARLVADIAALTPQPIRYVVVGSEHGDHRGGDAAFPPTATFIAHPSSRAALDRQAHAPARRAGAPPVVVPTDTVSDARTVTLGGREIRILFLGRAHTGGDLAVYLPRERIAFLSEMFLNGIFPSMANGFPSEWVAALRSAEQLDAAVWVSAHGLTGQPISLGKATVTTYRAALEQVIAQGRQLHDAHVPVDDAPARAAFGALASWHRYAENVAGALRRVYLDLDGALPAATWPMDRHVLPAEKAP